MGLSKQVKETLHNFLEISNLRRLTLEPNIQISSPKKQSKKLLKDGD